MTRVLTSKNELAPGKQCSWFREKPAFEYQCLPAGFSRNQLHLIHFVGVLFFASAIPTFAQTPHFVGRTGCATATCHGGLIGDGPIWHSSASRWEASDPHRSAGEVLLSNLARRIVAGLEVRSIQDKAIFANVLNDRCVSCHAPESIPSTAETDKSTSFSRQLARGVGCESCHGPASVWEKLHTQVDWSELRSLDPAVGMLETESLLPRVDNCSRCHVGSRTADGSIRDMNHDMIAAGHPVMSFDMYRYENTLPQHWDNSKSAFSQSSTTKLVSRAAAARARVLACAAKLSCERIAAASKAPQPELSEFDCAACHHQLSASSRSSRQPSSGFPSWNPWLTVSNSLNFATDQVRLDCRDLEKQMKLIIDHSDRRANRLLTIEQPDPLDYLKRSLASAKDDQRVRTQITIDSVHVRAWFDQIEIAASAAYKQLSENQLVHIQEILKSFRERKLGDEPGASARRLMQGRRYSERILVECSCGQADVELLCTELLSVVGEGTKGLSQNVANPSRQ